MDALSAFLSSVSDVSLSTIQLDDDSVNEYLADIFGASGLGESAKVDLEGFVKSSEPETAGHNICKAILAISDAEEYSRHKLPCMLDSLPSGVDPSAAGECLNKIHASLVTALPFLENYSQARKIVQLSNTLSLSVDVIDYQIRFSRLPSEHQEYIRAAKDLSADIQRTLGRRICTHPKIREALVRLSPRGSLLG